ncbi:MAG TPA: type II toxin-antitoxin system RelE/ParE family toxin [Armatimonadota bacterium]|jgi:proteic killer suppression protein
MRFSFAANDLAELYETGVSTKIHPHLVKAFQRVVDLIAAVIDVQELRGIKGLRMEKLHGDRDGQYSVRMNDQFRLIFHIERDDEGNYLLIIELVDYH